MERQPPPDVFPFVMRTAWLNAAGCHLLGIDLNDDLLCRKHPRLLCRCRLSYRHCRHRAVGLDRPHFGWQERVLKKMMQVHYESLSIRARMALAKITGWM